ncbi:FtsK/SpoIIIE domain-containing protein [Paenibacillus polymyxa]|uniref:FtsK/SpoIIIE domain-containing protein n=1 Tax=Paenibacillus polymyxa TaxID=1406 RepID=UPI0025B6D18A|nr:FtsK/SpoIIIE domain-containing protein [Paenibacillus polymyxa]MDN4090901.1 FtsK/SpoIIIE domain-containing protein [Paenibacillus polymyxa]
MQQMSGGQPPTGSKESFSVFFSKVAGITTLICVVVLMTDSPPSLQKNAVMIMKYAVGSWGVFVALPFILRSILKAPWQMATHLKTILRGLVIVIGLPFVIRTLWKNRHNLKGMFPRLINKWLESVGLGGLIANSSPSLVPELSNLQPGKEQSGQQDQSLLQSSLPAPYDRLPINPNPIPSSTLDPEMASNLIRSAIEQAGINLDQNIDVISVESGPTLQTISFRLPSNLQFSQLRKKHEDLATHLGFRSGFSITSSHHRSAAAFVVPHKERAAVYMRDVAAEFIEFAKSASIPMIFGKDSLGKAVFMDLAKLPHLLIAGSTGSGKSVFLNGLLASSLQSRSPSQLQYLMIDPKMVELSAYNGFPHLMSPVVTDPKRASLALQKVVVEMEKRYERMGKMRVRNIIQYNQQSNQKMPYIVVVIDEFADLIMVAAGDVEDAVQRITQMGRAAGIHLISATQRPSADVVTGTIKANLPSRVSFRLQGRVNYQVVLDSTDPNLLGMGDGVYMVNGGNLERFQSAAISINDDEAVAYIDELKTYWRRERMQQAGTSPTSSTLSLSKDSPLEAVNETIPDEQLNAATLLDEAGQMSFGFPGLEEEDHEEAAIDEEMYRTAVEWAKNPEVVFSVSLVQRHLRIGYSMAARIVDRMEREGLIGPWDGQNPGRKWIGGESGTVEDHYAGSPPWIDDEVSEVDEYTRFCQVTQDNGGFSMSIIQEHLPMDAETATRYVQRMIGEGLLGEFDDKIGKRPYIDSKQSGSDGELLEKLKVYICRTGSTKTSELRNVFQMRKEDILSLCKQLVEEGFLNDYTSKREGYTLAWTAEQREQFLQKREAEEEED